MAMIARRWGAIANLLVLVVSFGLESQLARIHLDQLGVHRPNDLFDRGQIHNQIIATVHSQCRRRVNRYQNGGPTSAFPLLATRLGRRWRSVSCPVADSKNAVSVRSFR